LTFRAFSNGILLVAILFLVSGTTGDPDLWGHVRFGQDMVAARTIRVPDTYSFTTDRPWVNHEWLSEVAMAAAYDCFGAAGLNLFRIAIVLGVLLLVWYAMPLVPDRLRILVASAGALGMLWRAYPIRPQLLSLLLFAILLKLVAMADNRKSFRPLLLIPVVMAAWVNLHGGWILGLAMLGLWMAITAVTASWRERMVLLGVLAASVAATLVNPYGYGMWTFLAATVGIERPMISDWLPLYQIPWNFWMPWIAALGLVLAAATEMRSRASLKLLAIAVVLGLMAVRVSRLDAFFAIAAMFFAARALGDRAAEGSATQAVVLPVRRSPVLTVCFAAVLVTAPFIILPRITKVPIAPGSVPDFQVARYVRDQHLKGTVLIWFDWGQYAIWQFGPDLKVSMDGRRETVYSPALVDAHLRFYLGEPGAARYADELHADYVWIPSALRVVRELKDNGWRAACEGPTSVLLTRHDVTTTPCIAGPPQTTRLFPRL
jgi:hypothetical protein